MREKGRKLIWKNNAKNFPNVGKKTDIQIQEAWRVTNKMNPERLTPRHIKIKMSKDKDISYLNANKLEMKKVITNKKHFKN